MTRLDDELDYVCAWGRWRIGQARNEPTAAAAGERHCLDPRVRGRHAHTATRLGSTSSTGRARLRLVTVGGAVLSGSRR